MLGITRRPRSFMARGGAGQPEHTASVQLHCPTSASVGQPASGTAITCIPRGHNVMRRDVVCRGEARRGAAARAVARAVDRALCRRHEIYTPGRRTHAADQVLRLNYTLLLGVASASMGVRFKCIPAPGVPFARATRCDCGEDVSAFFDDGARLFFLELMVLTWRPVLSVSALGWERLVSTRSTTDAEAGSDTFSLAPEFWN